MFQGSSRSPCEIRDWLDSLTLDPDTIASYRGQAEKWMYPKIGKAKLKTFNAKEAERFFSDLGRVLSKRDALNWRFGRITRQAGIGHWHAHESRHTAVSIMSNNGVPIQDISDTMGHKSTHVTETVYRHVIVPAIRGGASVMDDVFGDTGTGSLSLAA